MVSALVQLESGVGYVALCTGCGFFPSFHRVKADGERQQLSGVSISGDHCSYAMPGIIYVLHRRLYMHESQLSPLH